MEFIHLTDSALKLVLLISLPPLLVSLVVGLLVSLFQTLTQIQEQTLTFVPKIIAVILILILTASFLLESLRNFAIRCFDLIWRLQSG